MGLFEHFPYVNFHEKNIDWILRDIKKRDDDIANLQSRMTAAEGNITNLFTITTNLDGRVTICETDISGLKTRVDAAEDNITNLFTITTSLDGRVTICETDISGLKTRVDAAEDNITNLDGRVTNCETRITVNENDIANTASRLSTVAGNVSTLQTRVSTAETDIDALEAREQIPAHTAADAGKVLKVTSSNTIAWQSEGASTAGTPLYIDIGSTAYGAATVSNAMSTRPVYARYIESTATGNLVHIYPLMSINTTEDSMTFFDAFDSSSEYFGTTSTGEASVIAYFQGVWNQA